MKKNDTMYRAQIARLLLLTITALCCAEILARYAVPRISAIESRTANEQSAALRMTKVTDGAPTILIVGNSLLKLSVNPESLHKFLAPEFFLQRFIIENTDYNDWYFGIRNLLRSGSRPDTIALMLNPGQMISDQIRGTYSAFRLLSATDTISAGYRAHLHLTEISGLIVGHFSAYYGLREDLRKFAFQRVVPGSIDLAALLVGTPPKKGVFDEHAFEHTVAPRLRELKETCMALGIHCLLVAPPRPGGPDVSDRALMRIGQSAGFETSLLQCPKRWVESDFDSDHFHMNSIGADKFTACLAPLLRRAVERAEGR